MMANSVSSAFGIQSGYVPQELVYILNFMAHEIRIVQSQKCKGGHVVNSTGVSFNSPKLSNFNTY